MKDSAVPAISVVIPHRDDLEGLGRCLDALAGQSISRESYEIIVADNGSRIGIDAVRMAVAGRARLISAPEPGAGPARNRGVGAARGAILAFVDSDCLPEPDWLACGLAALEGGEVAGGAMKVLVVPGQRRTAAEAFELAFAFDNRAYVERKGFSVTANLFVRKSDFVRVGPFRVGVSEDQDWCRRAREAGLRLVYAPDAVVGHPARREWRSLIGKWRRIVAEQHALTRERRFGGLIWLARSWLIPVSILPHAAAIAITPRLHGLRERLLALEGLVGLRLWRFAEAHRALWSVRAKSSVDKGAI